MKNNREAVAKLRSSAFQINAKNRIDRLELIHFEFVIWKKK
jgi:hypothetical protein